MMDLICLFIFTYVANISNGKSLTYYSNFKFEDIVYGPEDVIEDYLTLADDPKGNLPDSYTACSSVFVKLATTDILVIQMLKQDGTPWYRFTIFAGREYGTMSEILNLNYDNPTTGTLKEEFFRKDKPLSPSHSNS